ncbi:hypothetical protein A6R68_02328 [Neotoma lepida]|uniref:Uncharacterized protein n=1 Tax=Neotoma lepida TaxID=56216 RepID=A0A1A6GT73_NEOLE|nr:hypothetical protein A6R68_02328 [Neotoma lepida]
MDPFCGNWVNQESRQGLGSDIAQEEEFLVYSGQAPAEASPDSGEKKTSLGTLEPVLRKNEMKAQIITKSPTPGQLWPDEELEATNAGGLLIPNDYIPKFSPSKAIAHSTN